MLHITKTKKGMFQVVLVGKNGEPLSTSELFPRKQAAKKNVLAQLSAVKEKEFQDDTEKDPRVRIVDDGDGVIDVMDGEEYRRASIYIPGKNPKNKKKV